MGKSILHVSCCTFVLLLLFCQIQSGHARQERGNALTTASGAKQHPSDVTSQVLPTRQLWVPGDPANPTLEVPWTWEKDSRGPTPKSLKKVSKKSPGAGPQKSGESLEKGPKSQRKTLFFDFSDLFRDFFRTFGARPRETFSRLFEDFLASGPETPSPRSTEPQPYPKNLIRQTNPGAHKNKIGTSTPLPENPNTPPLKRGKLWAWPLK